jgi:hypothetical protein
MPSLDRIDRYITRLQKAARKLNESDKKKPHVNYCVLIWRQASDHLCSVLLAWPILPSHQPPRNIDLRMRPTIVLSSMSRQVREAKIFRKLTWTQVGKATRDTITTPLLKPVMDPAIKHLESLQVVTEDEFKASLVRYRTAKALEWTALLLIFSSRLAMLLCHTSIELSKPPSNYQNIPMNSEAPSPAYCRSRKS